MEYVESDTVAAASNTETATNEAGAENQLESQPECTSTLDDKDYEPEHSNDKSSDEDNDEKNNSTPTPSDNQENGEQIKSRELKSLIAAAKESNLDTNIGHKRKSLPESDNRRSSFTSNDQDLSLAKRNMRSQNPEFVAKHHKFISKVASELELSEPNTDDENPTPGKRKRDSLESLSPFEEKRPRKMAKPSAQLRPGKDMYCWKCHKEDVQVQCVVCPRSFHLKCLKQSVSSYENWLCIECKSIENAENPKKKSMAMSRLTINKINLVLNLALKRMLSVEGCEPFQKPVDINELSDYMNYVVHPMDLDQLKQKIDTNCYLSTESFLADAKWILHNSILYNSSQSKLTTIAKGIVKTCKLETAEIETCPECYINANTKKSNWFIEVCSKPHILVWAKLKGFPFWPAKAVNWLNGMVDVRFFGAHDKAWVPAHHVYLYSDIEPNIPNKQQKSNIVESLREVDLHIQKLTAVYGKFQFAPLKTPFEPENEIAQLQLLLPSYQATGNQQIKHTYVNKTPKLVPKQNPKKIYIMNLNRENSGKSDENKSFHSAANEECSTEDDDSLNQSHDDLDSENRSENGNQSKSSTPSRSNFPFKIRISLDEVKKKKLAQSPNKSEESESKFPRRDSDVSSKSSKSDISRVSSDKINKLEFSESTEITLGNIPSIEAKHDEKNEIISKLKPVIEVNPVELINTNKEIRISPQGKTVISPKEKPFLIDEAKRQLLITSIRKSFTDLEKPTSTTSTATTATNSTTVNSNTGSDNEPDSYSEGENNRSESDNEKNKSGKKPFNKEITLVDVNKIIQGANISSPKEPPQVIVQPKIDNKNPAKPVEKNHKKSNETLKTPTIKVRPIIENFDSNNLIDPANIKEEIIDSEDEASNNDQVSKSEFFPALNLSPNVSVSVVDKQIIERRKSELIKEKGTKDNISKIIEDVAKGDLGEVTKKAELKVISVAEINQKKLDKVGNTNTLVSKQPRARKSFPRPSQSFITTKKIQTDRQFAKTDNNQTKLNESQKSTESQKDKMVYIPHSTPITLLQPNMSFNTMSNTTSNIFTMISQSGGQQKMSVCIPQTLFNSGGKALPLIPISTPTQTATTTTVPGSVPQRNDEERNNNTAAGLPTLKPRPSGPLSREQTESLPSNTGPVTQILNRSSQQIADYFRTVILETLNDISGMGCLETKIKEYQLDLETQKHKYMSEINQLKLEIASLKQSHAADRQRIIQETRQACEQERIRAIEEVKSKQWCANCFKESQYRCCWSTSYCSYSCQRAHWEKHKPSCEQAIEVSNKKDSTPSASDESITTTVIRSKAKNKTSKPTNSNTNHSNKGTLGILTTKANTQAVPTLTFVQNNTGGIELVGNQGPIQLGGKLITASAFPSKIKGYIVSSNSTTPNLTNLSNKSTPTFTSITSGNLNKTHNRKNSEVMEVDDD